MWDFESKYCSVSKNAMFIPSSTDEKLIKLSASTPSSANSDEMLMAHPLFSNDNIKIVTFSISEVGETSNQYLYSI